MTRRTYTPEYKAKLVIEVLQGEKELNTIAAENGISPNMLRNWKAEFLENAGRAFDSNRQAKEARRKEADLKKIQAQMLKTIGQLTLERDFLQGCFREAGWECRRRCHQPYLLRQELYSPQDTQLLLYPRWVWYQPHFPLRERLLYAVLHQARVFRLQSLCR